MAKTRLTRGKLLAAAAPLAAVPLVGQARARRERRAAGHDHSGAQPRADAASHLDGSMGHAAMIGDEAPAVGGPNDLDALLYPPPALPYEPGRVREYTLIATRRGDRGRPGRLLPRLDVQRHRPRPGDPRDRGRPPPRATSSNAGSHPHTIHFHGIHPTNMDGVFEIVEPGGRFTYEFPARPAGMQLYHCHATPLKKHIHKGLYGAFIIDPKEPRPPAQRARDGDERLRHGRRRREQLLHRQRAHVLLRALPDPGEALRARAHLPREPDRVRPDQLVPPARGLLPLPADRHGRPLGVHGHGDAVPGPARRARDRVRTTPARSCSTRTSRSSPSSAGWASSRSSD